MGSSLPDAAVVREIMFLIVGSAIMCIHSTFSKFYNVSRELCNVLFSQWVNQGGFLSIWRSFCRHWDKNTAIVLKGLSISLGGLLLSIQIATVIDRILKEVDWREEGEDVRVRNNMYLKEIMGQNYWVILGIALNLLVLSFFICRRRVLDWSLNFFLAFYKILWFQF